MDFLYSDQSPSLTYFIYKYKSWLKTKKAMKDLNEHEEAYIKDTLKSEVFERLEQQLPLKWPYEFAILDLARTKHTVTVDDVIHYLEKKFSINLSSEGHRTIIVRAMDRLSKPYKKQTLRFGSVEDEMFNMDSKIIALYEEKDVSQYYADRLEYGLTEFRRSYQLNHVLEEEKKLEIYQNYTRNDLIFLFEASAKEGTWREGVSKVDNHYLLFINLNKSEKVDEHLLYKDYFKDPKNFHWQSQNQTSHTSSVGQDYINHKKREIHIHLFVRKFTEMHGMTLPFTYLGEVDYQESHGDKPMNILWELHQTIPEDLFIDFIR